MYPPPNPSRASPSVPFCALRCANCRRHLLQKRPFRGADSPRKAHYVLTPHTSRQPAIFALSALSFVGRPAVRCGHSWHPHTQQASPFLLPGRTFPSIGCVHIAYATVAFRRASFVPVRGVTPPKVTDPSVRIRAPRRILRSPASVSSVAVGRGEKRLADSSPIVSIVQRRRFASLSVMKSFAPCLAVGQSANKRSNCAPFCLASV